MSAELKDAIRAAGGIVHSDGNIFFTNVEQFQRAASSERVALSDEAVREAVARTGLFFTAPDMQIARAIESAHGIVEPAPRNDAPTSQMKNPVPGNDSEVKNG